MFSVLVSFTISNSYRIVWEIMNEDYSVILFSNTASKFKCSSYASEHIALIKYLNKDEQH